MLNKLKPKSEFSRNVLTLMTGTTIAQAIPIAISPILTRIYTPADFGVFAIFLAITTIFGSISNARYELAIMLPEKDEDAINIVALGFLITLLMSTILFIIIVLFQDYFIKLLNNQEIGIWLYFVPITVLFIGLFNVLNYFNNRKKNYKDIANATIIKSIALSIVQVAIGFLKNGASGLISGQIIAQLFANVKLLKNIIKDKKLVSNISKEKMKTLAKRYINFPKFSMWAIFANTLSIHLTNVLISSFYSVATLGFYSLVQKVLGMPTALIGGSIGQVFFQEATKEKELTGKATKSFNTTVKKLIIIGVPVFSILYFIVEDIFAFVFGEEWRIAGQYAKIVIPLFFIRFISSSLSVSLVVFEKQQSELYINLILILIILLLVSVMDHFLSYLYLYTILISTCYLSFLIYYYILSRGKV
jgi:O-antigen/teichoic acid export membrane protein